jgi:hypothetical protein
MSGRAANTTFELELITPEEAKMCRAPPFAQSQTIDCRTWP